MDSFTRMSFQFHLVRLKEKSNERKTNSKSNFNSI